MAIDMFVLQISRDPSLEVRCSDILSIFAISHLVLRQHQVGHHQRCSSGERHTVERPGHWC